MRIRLAARLGVFVVLALVLTVVLAAPVGAKKVRDGRTCADAYGPPDYEWDTRQSSTYPLEGGDQVWLVKKWQSTVCIDVITDKPGTITVTGVAYGQLDPGQVRGFWAVVRDSDPGDRCDLDTLPTLGTLTLDVPIATTNACPPGGGGVWTDGHKALALSVGAEFQGKPQGSVLVTLEFQPTIP